MNVTRLVNYTPAVVEIDNPRVSVTRMGNLLDFEQLLKACGNK